MRRALFALPVLMLSACATPQQRCIADATHDLTVVNQLIAQLQTDIDRGYGTQEHQITVPTWRPCYYHSDYIDREGHRHHDLAPDMCLRDTVQTETQPVAIDLAEARKTLAGLQKKRDQLNRRAGPAIAQCQALYPEN